MECQSCEAYLGIAKSIEQSRIEVCKQRDEALARVKELEGNNKVRIPKFWKERDFGECYAYQYVNGTAQSITDNHSFDEECFNVGNYYEYTQDSYKHIKAKLELQKHVVAMIRKYGVPDIGRWYVIININGYSQYDVMVSCNSEHNMIVDIPNAIPYQSTEEEINERIRLLKEVYS